LFSFLIKKFNLKTPGRGEDEVKLYTRADYNKKNGQVQSSSSNQKVDSLSEGIVVGLGSLDNISDVDCCATRLRITVFDATKVNDEVLKTTGAAGVIHRGSGVQIIYGPKVTVIKSHLEEYMDGVRNGSIQEGTPSTEMRHEEKPQAEEKVEIEELFLTSPVKGKALPLEDVKDGVFSEHMLGDGIAFLPSEGIAYAPCDCVIDSIADTKHAINMVCDNGAELLLHIGLDTVRLQGKPFELRVKEGQKVKRGEILMKFDISAIKESGYPLYSPLIVTNSDELNQVKVLMTGDVDNQQKVLVVK
jgi:PTS system D-glucosamine-specific IIC component